MPRNRSSRPLQPDRGGAGGSTRARISRDCLTPGPRGRRGHASAARGPCSRRPRGGSGIRTAPEHGVGVRAGPAPTEHSNAGRVSGLENRLGKWVRPLDQGGREDGSPDRDDRGVDQPGPHIHDRKPGAPEIAVLDGCVACDLCDWCDSGLTVVSLVSHASGRAGCPPPPPRSARRPGGPASRRRCADSAAASLRSGSRAFRRPGGSRGSPAA
jgi:hypothetical protein